MFILILWSRKCRRLFAQATGSAMKRGNTLSWLWTELWDSPAATGMCFCTQTLINHYSIQSKKVVNCKHVHLRADVLSMETLKMDYLHIKYLTVYSKAKMGLRNVSVICNTHYGPNEYQMSSDTIDFMTCRTSKCAMYKPVSSKIHIEGQDFFKEVSYASQGCIYSIKKQ